MASYLNQIEAFRLKFIPFIEEAPSVLITTRKADDDGISSVLALYSILRQKYPGKDFKLAIRHFPNIRFHHLLHYDCIEFVTDITPYLSEFSHIVFLDGCQYNSWGIDGKLLADKGIRSVSIDHHDNTSDVFDVLLHIPQATSVCEIIYSLFFHKGAHIDSRLAEALLTGILGDTGALRHIDPSKAHIYTIIQNLILGQGIDLSLFVSAFKKYSEKQLAIVQEFVRSIQVQRFSQFPSCTFMHLNRNFVDSLMCTEAELDEAANFVASQFSGFLQNTEWGCVFYPWRDGQVKVKLRSYSRHVNVRIISEGMGLGGGHDRASGGMFRVSTKGEVLEPLKCFQAFCDWLLLHRYDKVLGRMVRI